MAKKRANGDGSIRKRKDGRWHAGPLLRRLHSGHLRPRHRQRTERSCQDYGQRAGGRINLEQNERRLRTKCLKPSLVIVSNCFPQRVFHNGVSLIQFTGVKVNTGAGITVLLDRCGKLVQIIMRMISYLGMFVFNAYRLLTKRKIGKNKNP